MKPGYLQTLAEIPWNAMKIPASGHSHERLGATVHKIQMKMMSLEAVVTICKHTTKTMVWTDVHINFHATDIFIIFIKKTNTKTALHWWIPLRDTPSYIRHTLMGHWSCTWIYTHLLLLISMLWHRQAIFESKGDKCVYIYIYIYNMIQNNVKN